MVESIISNIARLKDPAHVVTPILNDDGTVKISAERRLLLVQEKISQCLTRMYQKPGNGGNPFLFSYVGSKEHYLVGGDVPGKHEPLKTAATDGKQYYWNLDFLERLPIHQVTTVMMHEGNHILYGHCTPGRSHGKDPEDWNVALDYTNNATIEHGHSKAMEEAKTLQKQLPPLWGDELGEPVPLAELVAYIDGTFADIPGKNRVFSDIGVLNRGPESVYFEIQEHKRNSPRRCKTCGALSIDPKTKKSKYGPPPYPPGCCPACGAKPGSLGLDCGPMDSHMDSALSKEQIMSEMIQAAERAANFGRGYVPSEIEAALAELKSPTLSPHDIIVNAMQRKTMDCGFNNDYSRIKRRPQFIYEKNPVTGSYEPKHKIFNPKKYDYTPKWVALVDTSGSMSDEDIANGVKELVLVASIQDSEGWIVPCDAVPYWEQKTRITTNSDIKRTKIVGRGGTVFDQFFKELPDKIGTDVDIVVIVTDGDCGAHEMAQSLRPNCDVLWIITNRRDFNPAFGRVVQLNPARH